MKNFDVVVIGGGPGGYVAAIKAAQLGKKVACVEVRNRLGGTCLNVGCIPSKALLNSSHKYFEASKHFADHGIECTGLSISIDKMQSRKNKIIDSLGHGIAALFKKNKVTHLNGLASFIDKKSINVKLSNGDGEIIESDYFIIATGSETISLPGITIDEKKIVSSTGALALTQVPKKLVVLGGGVIGLEMGSVWSRLGAEVTVVEYAERILANGDADISSEMRKILEKQGLKFLLKTKALQATESKNGVNLEVESLDSSTRSTLESDILLVAVGRKPYTTNLNLENAGVNLDSKGRIVVDAHCKTDMDNIFAIGDVVDGPMLAHKASEEGIAVAEIISGQCPHINYDAIPSVVYTTPEVAAVGKTEEQLKASDIAYKVGKFPFLANSRAKTSGETDGFVKIIVDKSDVILGAHIIGPAAGELITEICLGMEFKAASEDIARTSHSHPGYSEALKEAASAAVFSKAIHF